MADRNRKAQLGARVPQHVRDSSVEAAKRAGLSLNEWVERALLAMIGDIQMPIVPHPQQTTLVDIPIVVDSTMAPGTMEIRKVADLKAFDANCSLKEYHWKHGPGRPCRRCGGEA